MRMTSLRPLTPPPTPSAAGAAGAAAASRRRPRPPRRPRRRFASHLPPPRPTPFRRRRRRRGGGVASSASATAPPPPSLRPAVCLRRLRRHLRRQWHAGRVCSGVREGSRMSDPGPGTTRPVRAGSARTSDPCARRAGRACARRARSGRPASVCALGARSRL